eukprot:2500937-Rhodomonas_salina.2
MCSTDAAYGTTRMVVIHILGKVESKAVQLSAYAHLLRGSTLPPPYKLARTDAAALVQMRLPSYLTP